MIGQVVGHYRVLAELGGGGMGVVYEAEDLRLGRRVALKFLSDAKLSSAGDGARIRFRSDGPSLEALERFRREARAASALNHPHICVVHELGEHRGVPFIVMERLDGQNLRQLAAGRALPVTRVLEIGAQIADALDAAHRVGIVHRDLKPANVFVTPRGDAKLLDFGLAKVSLERTESQETADRLTSPGAMLGTVAYMSPEQCRGEALDARSDVFSLGVLLYELATGRLPFDGATPAQIFTGILTESPRPLRELNPDVPSSLERTILTALEKDRAKRQPSARAVEDELRAILALPRRAEEPVAASAPPASRLGPYELQDSLGSGSLGEVYRAWDTRLGRSVAVKLLPRGVASDPERRERLRREAVAASALNHPNICTVHDVVEADGRALIVMELVEGATLDVKLAAGRVAPAQAIAIASQVADALDAAHRSGIVHRGVKPRNIAVTSRGHVKVLDFGLTSVVSPGTDDLVRSGHSGGVRYASPEQLEGRDPDPRSDLFALGVVLYEMLTGHPPFEGSTPLAVATAVLHGAPAPFDARVPRRLQSLVRRMLERDSARRPNSASDVRAELLAIRATPRFSRPVRVAAGVLALAAAVGGAWAWQRWSRERWVREVATPEITRLMEARRFTRAVALLRQARETLPGDASLEKMWLDATVFATFNVKPHGVLVEQGVYGQGTWEPIGTTPATLRVSRPSPWAEDVFGWRFSRPGYAPVIWYGAPPPPNPQPGLVEASRVPEGMVTIWTLGLEGGLAFPYIESPGVAMQDFLIDRDEVTNRDFQKFVEAGGYAKRELWKQRFVRDGREIPWEEAMASFRDATGRPGPATWELGTYPAGKELHPVGGVSWYEAAAYAEFVGKVLPTAWEWTWAADPGLATAFVPGGAFDPSGTRPVGDARGATGFGTRDMAGNVKEWAWNESSPGDRFLLGGGFGDPTYLFSNSETASAWSRGPSHGFRCSLPLTARSEALLAAVPMVGRDPARVTPVPDDVFEAFRGLYRYDRTPLKETVDATTTTPDWTLEKVSFDAAYGTERIVGRLYLPRNAQPPYQVVVYFPQAGAFIHQDVPPVEVPVFGFLPRTGRAVFIPSVKGALERRADFQIGVTGRRHPAKFRDYMLAWSKDVRRSVDYLETRADIDASRIAYYGFSLGAQFSAPTLASEPRFKAAILLSGGLPQFFILPEVDPLNFAPRAKMPVLMINGRFDGLFPPEGSQLPLFNLFGAPEAQKKRFVAEGDHFPPIQDTMRETLDWLDKHLGPVSR